MRRWRCGHAAPVDAKPCEKDALEPRNWFRKHAPVIDCSRVDHRWKAPRFVGGPSMPLTKTLAAG